jgi:hypothetical protein
MRQFNAQERPLQLDRMNREDSPLLGVGSSRSNSESTQQFHGQERLAREQPQETVSVHIMPDTGTGTATPTDNVENDSHSQSTLTPREQDILVLMNKLRCCLALITWPILPLGFLTTLALIWFVSSALNDYFGINKDSNPCAPHTPIMAYAWTSQAMILYIPWHYPIRQRIAVCFRGSSESLTVTRTIQCFDRIAHAASMVYVAVGLSIWKTCRIQNDSSCRASCPAVTRAFDMYAPLLGLFTVAAILPLMCLPCIYLWFVRQATSIVPDAETLAVLRQRWDPTWQPDDVSGVDNDLLQSPSSYQVLQNLREVRIQRRQADRTLLVTAVDVEDGFVLPETMAHPHGLAADLECCICMSRFEVVDGFDCLSSNSRSDSTALSNDELPFSSTPNKDPDRESIVQTIACGHLFHKRCLTNWIVGPARTVPRRAAAAASTSSTSGRDNANNAHSLDASNSRLAGLLGVDPESGMLLWPHSRHLPAQRTTCPLCRTELLPPIQSDDTNSHAAPSTEYNTL